MKKNLTLIAKTIISVFLFFGSIISDAQISGTLDLNWEPIPVEITDIHVIGVVNDSVYYGFTKKTLKSKGGLYKSNDKGLHWEEIRAGRITDAELYGDKIYFAEYKLYFDNGPDKNDRSMFRLDIQNGEVENLKTFSGRDDCCHHSNTGKIKIFSEQVFGYTTYYQYQVSAEGMSHRTNFHYTLDGGLTWQFVNLSWGVFGGDNFSFTKRFDLPFAFFNGKFISSRKHDIYYGAEDSIDIVAFNPDDSFEVDSIGEGPGIIVTDNDSLYVLKEPNVLWSTADMVNWNQHTLPFDSVSQLYYRDSTFFLHTPDAVYKTQLPSGDEFVELFVNNQTLPYSLDDLMLFADGDDYLAYVGGNKCVRSTDGGHTWRVDSSANIFSMRSLYAFESDGVLYGHRNWRLNASGYFETISDDEWHEHARKTVTFSNDSILLKSGSNAVTHKVYIKRSLDGGETWGNIRNFDDVFYFPFKFYYKNGIYYAFAGWRFIESSNDGQTWDDFENSIGHCNYFSIDENGVYVVDDGVLHVRKNNGDMWLSDYSAYFERTLSYDKGRFMSYSNADQNVYITDDFGVSWQETLNFDESYDFGRSRAMERNIFVFGQYYSDLKAHNYLTFDTGKTFYEITGPFLIDNRAWGDQFINTTARFEIFGDYLYAFGDNGIWRAKIFPSIFDQEAIICNGESFEFGPQTLTESGVYYETFTDENGQDSVASLYLNVLEDEITQQSIELTYGETFNDIPIYSDTTITEHFVSTYGCDSTVITNISMVVSVDDLAAVFSNVNIIPNPVGSSFELNFTLKKPTAVSIDIVNVLGEKVHTVNQRKAFSDGQQRLEIDTGDWQPGVYFVVFKTENGRKTKVLVKQ